MKHLTTLTSVLPAKAQEGEYKDDTGLVSAHIAYFIAWVQDLFFGGFQKETQIL